MNPGMDRAEADAAQPMRPMRGSLVTKVPTRLRALSKPRRHLSDACVRLGADTVRYVFAAVDLHRSIHLVARRIQDGLRASPERRTEPSALRDNAPMIFPRHKESVLRLLTRRSKTHGQEKS